jgi:hypothetical protein
MTARVELLVYQRLNFFHWNPSQFLWWTAALRTSPPVLSPTWLRIPLTWPRYRTWRHGLKGFWSGWSKVVFMTGPQNWEMNCNCWITKLTGFNYNVHYLTGCVANRFELVLRIGFSLPNWCCKLLNNGFSNWLVCHLRNPILGKGIAMHCLLKRVGHLKPLNFGDGFLLAFPIPNVVNVFVL